ncbi:hypothetical protein JQS43_01350 [Natronosporangium hydrolyticum]|uniref:Intracellular proteinase inhibitor BsuPI domain-containing protein n=1 Tax=Natronosporangium hydrolyticum TaxID=2811111 RepID=A0A895YBC4_9ACTN|nr:hypothetical protein [Natronosporangium hydrolyticum]QSB15057.1 hypothetical protein JQS43_01350 [Natronosporangium hydrolyticum]
MRLTVGPLPPAVYWRRRALVLGAILLVLFLVAQACMAASASQDGDTAAPTPTSTSSPPGQPSPPGSPAPDDPTGDPTDPEATEDADADPEPSGLAEDDLGEAGCTDDELLVVAEAEPTTVGSGEATTFTIRYQNSSDRACQRDIGDGRRELFLRAGPGSPPLWSSRDCQDLRGSNVQELAPGIENEHFIAWQGRGSEACDGAAAAGDPLPPGDYQLIARVGTAHSEPVTITVSG